jgi:pentapeptide MXKDX repeat protein
MSTKSKLAICTLVSSLALFGSSMAANIAMADDAGTMKSDAMSSDKMSNGKMSKTGNMMKKDHKKSGMMKKDPMSSDQMAPKQ